MVFTVVMSVMFVLSKYKMSIAEYSSNGDCDPDSC